MYKRLICLICYIVTLSLVGNVFAQGPVRDFDIPYASDPPVLDGQVDGTWGAAPKQTIAVIIQGEPLTSELDCSGTWQVMWDTEYLYVLVEIFDDALFNDTVTNLWRDDSVEFYFDGGNSKDVYPGSGNLTVYDNNRQTTFGWHSDQIMGSNSNPQGVEHAQADTPTGWRLEVKLPWLSLQDTAPQVGDLIGIECGLNDDDDGSDTRETQMATFSVNNDFWRDPSQWGTAMLLEPNPGSASNPTPADQATGVSRDIVLSWTPGKYAPAVNGHKVYFGESFGDVNDAIGGITQSASSYDPGRLDFGTTYYWRVDEVNAPPDSTVFPGDVWRFTTEPVGYPIDSAHITATASSAGQADFGPEKTIDGSGLDENGLHSIEATDMWLSGDEPQGAWIQYEFDKLHKLHQMWVWNSNQMFEALFGFGIKDATVEYSTDGTNWTAVADVPEFTRAPGAPGYAHDTTIDFGGAPAKYVKLTATSNWGGLLPQYGLSEVRFFATPVSARSPSPASGATDVAPDVTLTWQAGREAATHSVYLSTDQQAVIDGGAPMVSVTGTSYSTTLNLGTTYYWRVDEVNEAEMPTTWQGDLWDFTTQQSIMVEDFEDYNDYPPYEVYSTWLDGYENPANGSQVGYLTPPAVETTIVHSGRQSMPLIYSNTGGAAYSEATRMFAVAQNWAKYGIQTLGLWFYGTAGNTGQLYVKINGVKVPYDGDAGNLALPAWQPWNIDLTTVGVNLQSVTSLAIGIDGNAAAGTLYIDNIRLYANERQLVTPVQPDPTGLAGHWSLDGNFNDNSGNGRNGTPMGGPTFAPGKIGQAISLDGVDDYVEITGYKGILQSPWTLSCWLNTTTAGNLDILSWGTEGGGLKVEFRLHDGRLRVEHGNGNNRGDALVHDGNWHHVMAILPEGGLMEDVVFYLDGKRLGIFQIGNGTNPFITTAGIDLNIGRSGPTASRYFNGMIDDVQIFERVLAEVEIAWLAGRTLPYDEPF